MPTSRRPESESSKSESDSKKSEVQNPRRESVACTPSGTDQTQTDMKKFMKEIKGMFTKLKQKRLQVSMIDFLISYLSLEQI